MIRLSRLLPEGVTAARIVETARHYGAHNVRLFGSRIHGTAKDDSDIDLLVDFDAGRDLFDLVELKQSLESLTGLKVDVLTERARSYTAGGRESWLFDAASGIGVDCVGQAILAIQVICGRVAGQALALVGLSFQSGGQASSVPTTAFSQRTKPLAR